MCHFVRVVSQTRALNQLRPRFGAAVIGYATNGQAMTYVMGETWNNDGSGIEDYTRLYAREFRYDGGRQRYMNAELNTTTFVPTETIWSDYDGDSVYADFKFGAMGMLTRLTSFEPGIGRVKSPLMYPPDVAYYHADHIGTTRHLSDADGDAIEPGAFTAFGEQVSGAMQDPSQRYGYAGAWGYQTHEDFPFLHVGARYYDPAAGRFLQRDPIGVFGGLNLYKYARNSPTAFIDPDGLAAVPQEVIDYIISNGPAAAEKAADILTQLNPKRLPRSPIGTVATALQCGPDLFRTAMAAGHRSKSLREGDDAADILDKIDAGRGQYVHPGSGN